MTKPSSTPIDKLMITHAWHDAISQFLSAQTAAGFPKTTIATRRQHLQHLARRINTETPYTVTADQLVAFAAQQTWARETRRGRRTTFRAFFGWAVATGRLETSPAVALPRVKMSEPRPAPAPERIYREALMRATPREQLMLRLAGELGLRRAEVAAVHSDDLDDDLVGYSLTVHGKGGRVRTIPVGPGLAILLRNMPYGFAFPGDDHGHLSPRWVGKLVTNLLEGDWTMHKLRHRFATRAYGVDRDTFTVQQLLGHASPATTRLYVKVPNEALRSTIDAIAG